MTPDGIKTYEQFWPYYLQEHSHPMTRKLHVIGTTLGILVAIVLVGDARHRLLVRLVLALLHREEPASDVPISVVVVHLRLPHGVLVLSRPAQAIDSVYSVKTRAKGTGFPFFLPHSSIRRSSLYFAVRSERDKDPVLI
jgi:hypothetical protein